MALNLDQLKKMTETLVKQRLQDNLKPTFQGVVEMAKTMADTHDEQRQIRLDLLQMIEGSFIELLKEQQKRTSIRVS